MSVESSVVIPMLLVLVVKVYITTYWGELYMHLIYHSDNTTENVYVPINNIHTFASFW